MESSQELSFWVFAILSNLLVDLDLYRSKGVSALHAVCPPHTDARCPENFTEIPQPQLCLRVLDKRSKYRELKDACAELGAVPVVLDNKNLARSLAEVQRKDLEKWFWLDLSDRFSHGTWKWAGGQVVSSTDKSIWREGFPSTNTTQRKSYAVISSYDYRSKNIGELEMKAGALCIFKLRRQYCETGGFIMLEQGSARGCYRFYGWMYYYEALKTCGRKTKLLSFSDPVWKSFFREMVAMITRVALDISDIEHETVWKWRSGAPTNFVNWAKNEPTDTRVENCAMIDVNQLWYDSSCDSPFYVACQIESIDSPDRVRMRLLYHAPPSTVYDQQMLQVSCSAIHASNNTITWYISGRDSTKTKPSHYGGSVYNKIEGVRTYSDVCENKTTSTLVFKVDRRKHHGIYISCYGYDADGAKSCTHIDNRFSFCDISHKLEVLSDGPLQPPLLNISYPGYPGSVDAGTTVRAKCTLLHGGKGVVVWVVYYPSGPIVLDHLNDTLVSYSTTKSASVNVITSNLSIAIQEKDTEVVIGCFSWDVARLRKDLQCYSDEIYCVKSLTIKVTEVTTIKDQILYLLLLLVVVLVVISCCYLLFTTLGKSEAYSGERPN